MSFLDFVIISERRANVVVIEIELSDWLLAIFIPLEDIYLQSHITLSAKLSSLIPLRFINTTLARIAGAVIVKC